MATDGFTFTVSGTMAALVIERLYAYMLAPKLRTKEEQRAFEGAASGDKDPAYWKAEFREAIDEKLDQRVLPILKQLADNHTDMVSLLKDRTSYFQQQTDLLKELVDVSRKRRR